MEDFEPVGVRVFIRSDGQYGFCDASRGRLDCSGVAYDSPADATRAAIAAARNEGRDVAYLIGDAVSQHVASQYHVTVRQHPVLS